MANIILQEAGAVIGGQLLPNGVALLGQEIAGAAIGRTLGGLAGSAIDRAIFGSDISAPRLSGLHISESREGAGIPNIYGRMRIGGQVIWAGRFRETREEAGGGKGGPSLERFTYTVSFAVALCEGPGVQVERAWANGEPLRLSQVTHRVYPGTDEQVPDPLIEVVEGVGEVPAYRGTAYIVFEDLPLEPYGNRLPQLSFEISRVPPAHGGALGDAVTGVNIIPASGEFVYASEIVSIQEFPATERPVNANNSRGDADFEVSLDQLTEELPRARDAALTVGWFGDDLRAGDCRIRPGVEARHRVTVPWAWQAGGVGRGDAHLISGAEDGAPNMGGTPADRAVRQGIAAMKARGLSVTYSPFLLMDIAPGNSLPDPRGASSQPAFPWRGRITSPDDGRDQARSDVTAFLGQVMPGDFHLDGDEVIYTGDPDDWGFRRFILHQAWLARAAGGVAAFLIGSEMRALTRVRDGAGGFPFVDGLVNLAGDVKAVLGSDTAVSYAADWSEYGAFVPGDGSGDVLFPLDPFWASPDVDFVGIDWYPPAGDWRDGADHLDALAGFSAPDDPAYLRANFTGGEDYDWFYASPAARDAQARSAILDTAHGEDWVFRAKDLAGWWNNAHHPRPGGVRASQATGWVAGSKPVRLSEIGFPALDKGGNSPNLFYDPKSSESALPPYSSGARDDVFQRRALVEAFTHFTGLAPVEQVLAWAWDARPYPAFPVRSDVWSDGDNWQFGHWLNGRTGLVPLGDIARDLAVRGGVDDLVADGLEGIVSGFGLDGPLSLRAALEPLREAFGMDAVERAGRIELHAPATQSVIALDPGWIAGEGARVTRSLLDKAPGRLELAFADLEAGHQPGLVEARCDGRDIRNTQRVSLPIAFSQARAEQVAARLLTGARTRDQARLAVSLAAVGVEPGMRVTLPGQTTPWRVREISESQARLFSLEPGDAAPVVSRAVAPPDPGAPASPTAQPELILIDPPALPGVQGDGRPLVGAVARPWPGTVQVLAGADATSLTARAALDRPARFGRLALPLPPGPVGRWDRANTVHVEMPGANLSSASALAVLGGANALLVETPHGWELLAYLDAELVAPGHYRLHGLLRGLQGSDAAAAAGALTNASCVVPDDALQRASFSAEEIGLALVWKAGRGGSERVFQFDDAAGKPWPVTHLRRRGERLSWIRRGPDISASWSLPERDSAGLYEVEWDVAGQFGQRERVDIAEAVIPSGATGARVRSIGDDARAGPWVTIGLWSV